MICERCGLDADKLYPVYHVKCHDDTPHKYDPEYCGKSIQVCWDCDWEVTNGWGEPDEDSYEVLMARWDNEYDCDQINTDVPPWRMW